MFIKVIDSGSQGNGYIVGDEQQQLVIECGVPFRNVEKALHFDLSTVVGCLCSHDHLDHIGFAREYIMHLPIYATKGTLEVANLLSHPNARPLPYMKVQQIGNFSVLPFKTQHDAKEPCGFLVQLPDKSKLLFATDTYYLHYTFKGINHWLIECNYDERILSDNLNQGTVHPKVARRVRTSHMSLAQCINTLKANDLSQTKEIILIHLSSQNSNRKMFVNEISRATGKYVIAAQKGLNIELL